MQKILPYAFMIRHKGGSVNFGGWAECICALSWWQGNRERVLNDHGKFPLALPIELF